MNAINLTTTAHAALEAIQAVEGRAVLSLRRNGEWAGCQCFHTARTDREIIKDILWAECPAGNGTNFHRGGKPVATVINGVWVVH